LLLEEFKINRISNCGVVEVRSGVHSHSVTWNTVYQWHKKEVSLREKYGRPRVSVSSPRTAMVTSKLE
jgi:hypothetical protein